MMKHGDLPRRKLPPGCGTFDSGHTDNASRHEEVLGQVAAYREMAADERREDEAREWAESTFVDVAEQTDSD